MEERYLKTSPVRPLVGLLRTGYVVCAWLVAASIMVQVFLAGLNVFLGPRWLGSHITFGHMIGAEIIGLLLLALIAHMPRRVWLLNLLMVGLFALQYNHRALGAAFGLPQLAALHAVNALVLFWSATTLGRWSWQLVRGSNQAERLNTA